MSDAQRHIGLGFTDERYPEGTHICYLYNDDEERRRILPLFARASLREHECFSYVTELPDGPGLASDMRAVGRECSREGLSGRFEIASARDVYFPHGSFDPDALLAHLRAACAQCKASGYAGARFSGEMSWALRAIPGTERIIECESRINELIKEAPMTVMCQYDLREFDGATMFDVMSVHPVMIVGGHILRNPFYRQSAGHGHPPAR